MRKDDMIKIEFSKDKNRELISNYDLIESDIEYENLENEIRIIDYIESEIEIKLYHDFNIYDYDLFSSSHNNKSDLFSEDDSFEIYINREYSLYFDKESDDFHYFFEISDINDEDYKIFSIEIFNYDNLDIIYDSIKNYIYSLIDYSKKIFNEENED